MMITHKKPKIYQLDRLLHLKKEDFYDQKPTTSRRCYLTVKQ